MGRQCRCTEVVQVVKGVLKGTYALYSLDKIKVAASTDGGGAPLRWLTGHTYIKYDQQDAHIEIVHHLEDIAAMHQMLLDA